MTERGADTGNRASEAGRTSPDGRVPPGRIRVVAAGAATAVVVLAVTAIPALFAALMSAIEFEGCFLMSCDDGIHPNPVGGTLLAALAVLLGVMVPLGTGVMVARAYLHGRRPVLVSLTVGPALVFVVALGHGLLGVG